jgi:hypothetical protein
MERCSDVHYRNWDHFDVFDTRRANLARPDNRGHDWIFLRAWREVALKRGRTPRVKLDKW